MKKEFVKKFLLCGIAFISYYLAISLSITGTSLFLKKIGPNFLPQFLIVTSSIFLLYSLINTAISQRFSVPKIFAFLLLCFIGLFGALQVVGAGDSFGISFLYLLSAVLFLVLQVNLFKFVNSLVTPLQAKTYLPLVSSFQNLGVIFGSFFVGYFQLTSQRLGMGILPIILSSIILVLVIVVLKLFKQEIETKVESEKKIKLLEEMKKSFHYVFFQSMLFRVFAVMTFFITGVKYLTEFKMNTVLAQSLSSADLSATLGFVYTIENILLLALNFFILRKALFRFGVSNLLILYPVIYLFVLIIATLFGLDYKLVIALFLVNAVSYLSYVTVSHEQVLSVVPKDINRSVYFLLRGILAGIFSLFFACLLLIFSYKLEWEKYLNTAFLFILGSGLLVCYLKIKKLYFEELKGNLFKSDFYLKVRSIDLLAEKVYRENGENYLRNLLVLKTLAAELKAKVIYSLGIIGNYQTISDLIEVLRKDEPKAKFAAIQAINSIIKNRKQFNKYPISKYLLLKAYEELFLSDVPLYIKLEVIASLKFFDLSEVIHFLEEHLQSDDYAIKTNIIETLGSFDDRAIIVYLKPYLDDVNLHVICAAIVALWKFKDKRLVLLSKLSQILGRKDNAAIESSLFLIGSLQAVWEKAYVVNTLKHKEKHLKIYALMTLIQLGELNRVDELLKQMVKFSPQTNQLELEFILSIYRRLNVKAKQFILHKIQQFPEEKVEIFRQAFRNSRYVFNMELVGLS